MKYVKIVSCADKSRWYSRYVGKIADYIPRYDNETEYGSREPAGYINFVLKKDAEIIEVDE